MNGSKGLLQRQSSTPWHLEETYRALIPLSVEAIKMLALVNGGAAVAILAYLGNLAKYVAHQPNMVRPLMWFCAGLLASATTFIVAYHTQLRLYQEERDRADGKPVVQLHGYLITVGSFLLFFAAVAFAVGCYTGASAMKKATHPARGNAAVTIVERAGFLRVQMRRANLNSVAPKCPPLAFDFWPERSSSTGARSSFWRKLYCSKRSSDGVPTATESLWGLRAPCKTHTGQNSLSPANDVPQNRTGPFVFRFHRPDVVPCP
jgi:hypothetical protein